MKLDKKTMGKIVLLILAAAVIFIGMMNLGKIFDAIGFVVGLFTPFTIGLCIAFILNIPMKIFEEKVFGRFGRRPGSKSEAVWNKLRRPISMVLSFILVLIIIALIVLMIVPTIIDTVMLLRNTLPGFVDDVFNTAESLLIEFGVISESIFELEFNWNYLTDAIKHFFTSGTSTTIVSTTYEITAKIFGAVFDFVMSLVFSIYVLATKEKLGGQIKKLFAAFLPDRVADFIIRIGTMANNIFSNFVTGQLTEAVILGSLCFIGMSIFRFPYALMVSVLVGVTALIPVVGAFIGAGVGAFLILISDPLQALWFLIFVLILQQLEGNIIYPRVVGKSVGLSGMWVLLAVLVGSSVGGAVGMLISVPTFSLVYALISEFVRYMLLQRGKITPEQAHDDKHKNDPEPPKPLREVYRDIGKNVRSAFRIKEKKKKKKPGAAVQDEAVQQDGKAE